MIINYLIPPHPSLKLFIANYILSTSNDKLVTFKSFWPASTEASLIFHLADQPEHHTTNDPTNSTSLQHKDSCIVGLLSNFNGVISFSGIYHRFVILFKANGFYNIFRMPFSEFSNKIYCLEEVFGKSALHLQQELIGEKDVLKMACYADKFLLTFVNRHKNNNINDGITAISNEFDNDLSSLNIKQYAYKANMSIRNFERKFTEQVGVSPKFYHRLVRFNNALITKLKHPQKNWTSIAYECGYYDQMHMIKDFKQFTNLNPSHFLQPQTDFTRPRIDVTGSNIETFRQLTTNLTYEKFVPVNRGTF